MRYALLARLCGAGICLAVLAITASAPAQTVTWGVNGAGGSGTWNTSNVNWYTGASNTKWPSGGNAVFAGAGGGTVSASYFDIVVSAMTFNTPGYVIQDGWIDSGVNGLTVTTNAAATIGSTVSSSGLVGDFIIKNGAAPLTFTGTIFMDSVQVNQGELRLGGNSTLFFSKVALANTPGVAVTLGQDGTNSAIGGLSGGGSLGGIVHPDSQARTVSLGLWDGGSFAGRLEDNGSGILAVDIYAGSTAQIFTSPNTYSGPTEVSIGTLALAGQGSVLNSAISTIGDGRLLLDNSGTVLANRVSDAAAVTMNRGTIELLGNTTTPVEEILGTLSFAGYSNVTVTQPGSAAAQMTFGGLQRLGHATLDVTGPGVSFAGLSNGDAGILSPYITAGNEWAKVGSDGRVTPWTEYVADINAAAADDHVKISAAGSTSLATATTRASLNLQNGDAAVSQVLNQAGQNLELTTGGILSSGAGASTIRNGSLSTAAREMVVINNNNLTIDSTIIDNGGATTLTKSGPGVLTLTSANTYTGPTAIMEGTVVVSSDASLGLGTTIALGGGTLRAAADFTSAKAITADSSFVGRIDTAGHAVTLTGAISALSKAGPGMLTITNPAGGINYLDEGVLNLPNAVSGSVILHAGTLQVAGTLSSLYVSPLFSSVHPVLDLGGLAATTLTTRSFHGDPNSFLLVDVGLGSSASDLWKLTGSLSSNSGTFQFAFHNLGGVAIGVDYQLMSFGVRSPFITPSMFSFSPEMAALGWTGTFSTTPNGVFVRFATVPEPGTTAILLLEGAAIALVARRRRRYSNRPAEFKTFD